MSLIFPLVLEKAYYRQGFFNARVEFDKHIIANETSIEIRVPECSRVIHGRIDRQAQRNGTARIMGGAAPRDCFQAAFEQGEQVNLCILSPTLLEIRKR
jgi:hypothetical protein